MDHEEVMRQRNAAHAEAMRGADEIAQTKLRAALESTEAKAAVSTVGLLDCWVFLLGIPVGSLSLFLNNVVVG